MVIAKQLTKNKYLSIVFAKSKNILSTWFYFNMSFSTKMSHAGFNFCIGIGLVYFELEITDNRHWDYENSKFLE